MKSEELDFEAESGPQVSAPEPDVPGATGAIEYDAPNGDTWRMERGADLIRDFELPSDTAAIQADALQKFHGALCNQEPAWNVICRIYGNAPLYGMSEPDEVRAWTLAELAEKRGVEPGEIDALIQGAKSYLKRFQIEAKSTENIKVRPALDDETADRLLLENGFGLTASQEERKYTASRCMELQPWLEDDRLRAAARSLIQQEVTLFFILDPGIREVRALIADKATKRQGAEKENSQLMSLLKERRDAQTALDGGMKVLGLSDAAGGTLKKRMAFNDCLSILMEAVQRYYSDEDRDLIDGLFTAAEVEILTTPTELRPAQYRPDLVLSALEASKHLWEKDWSATKLSRRACRKLAAGFNQGLSEARSLEGGISGDEVVEEEISDETASGSPAVAGPLETSLQQGDAPQPATAARTPASKPAAMFT